MASISVDITEYSSIEFKVPNVTDPKSNTSLKHPDCEGLRQTRIQRHRNQPTSAAVSENLTAALDSCWLQQRCTVVDTSRPCVHGYQTLHFQARPIRIRDQIIKIPKSRPDLGPHTFRMETTRTKTPLSISGQFSSDEKKTQLHFKQSFHVVQTKEKKKLSQRYFPLRTKRKIDSRSSLIIRLHTFGT